MRLITYLIGPLLIGLVAGCSHQILTDTSNLQPTLTAVILISYAIGTIDRVVITNLRSK